MIAKPEPHELVGFGCFRLNAILECTVEAVAIVVDMDFGIEDGG